MLQPLSLSLLSLLHVLHNLDLLRRLVSRVRRIVSLVRCALGLVRASGVEPQNTGMYFDNFKSAFRYLCLLRRFDFVTCFVASTRLAWSSLAPGCLVGHRGCSCLALRSAGPRCLQCKRVGDTPLTGAPALDASKRLRRVLVLAPLVPRAIFVLFTTSNS